MTAQGYLDSPWPGEDGGPQRLQSVGGPGLGLQAGERLGCTTRNTLLSTMTVLGAPGEVYLLTHSALRSNVGLPTTAQVERIDPHSLHPLAQSPRLAGGPMWPGAMALHRNGSLYVVYGRHAHWLDRDCRLLASRRLPQHEACNGFVILDNGLIVTKNLSDREPARLTVLDPDRLQSACEDLIAPEPSIARLSSVGNTVYLVGVRSILRFHWDAAAGRLRQDDAWRHDYVAATRQTWGWDVVLDGRNAWFMDNGQHRYRMSMLGAGVSDTPNRLVRVSLDDARDHSAVVVSGLAGGSITNPPLVDPVRGIVVAHDAANRFVRAWRIDARSAALEPLWEKPGLGMASHALLYAATGELVLNDYRRWREELVVLDIGTGAERARVRVGGLMQGVVFPSPGWERDFYWCSMGRLARVWAGARSPGGVVARAGKVSG